ncbi:hypothetical protein BCR32DRAFT_273371 [Anaeromyces robustus]|uniref:Zn(2)-C6 fungal-type domain-containing protein n=1 Tax=Anaeromyces robustus TaxID=1754192 RepID=A0A1Y1VSB4_9FUNG|nr:hypothetical protein BCR32DRAFT_273371 [Anaeromyces robustus]|eukprot:ORX63654.1 hypothetical protein BCR32DRAFT_273371 [Anaeromyces robustus]
MIEENCGNNVVKSKRKRSSKACDACHKKKIKCDGRNPCSNCEYSKIPCVFSPRTKKRGPRAGYVGIMEKKLRDMESFLMDHGINCISNQQTIDFNSKINNTTNLSEKKTVLQASVNNNIENQKKNNNSFDNDKNINNEIPEEEETEVIMPLIEIFFKSVNTHMPVIHKLTFYDKLQPINKVSSLLLYAIYLISTRYIDNPDNYYPESVLLKKVKILLEKNLDKPSMETLQAVIILSVHFSGMSIGSSEWIYSGMAHRMAQLLKYNCEISTLDESSIGPFEKEYRKRLWWICYLNDKYVSAFANRPLLIDENDTYITLPVESKIWETIKTDEEYENQNFQQIYFKSDLPYMPASVELNLFSRQIILGTLLGKVLTFKEHQHEKINNEYTVTTDSDVTLLDTSLKNWFRSLPDSIIDIDNYDFDVKTIWLNSFLLVKYYTILILLHQPLISKSANSNIDIALNVRNQWFSSHSFDTCLLSVEAITKIIDKLISTNNITIISPFFIFCVFQSCIVILVNILNSRIDSLKPDKKYEKFLAIHLSLLLRIRDQWRIARIYLERFFEICKFFDYNYEYACIAYGIDPSPISLSYSQLTFNDTVTDNVIASSNWINFLTILNNIQNYFNTNNKLPYFNNDVEPLSLNIIEPSNNIDNSITNISSIPLKNESSKIKDENSGSENNDIYYNPTVSADYQQAQNSIIMHKSQSPFYENSLKSTQSTPNITQANSNSNSSLVSISRQTPQYTNSSRPKHLIDNNGSFDSNDELNQQSSSISLYTSTLPLHEITDTNLYQQLSSNNIVTNNNTSDINYLYMPSELINTTSQQNTKSFQANSFYNYINDNNAL